VIRLGNTKDKAIFSRDTLLLPSSEGIISEVRDNPNAIGYDGMGYVTSEVKVVAISGLQTPINMCSLRLPQLTMVLMPSVATFTCIPKTHPLVPLKSISIGFSLPRHNKL